MELLLERGLNFLKMELDDDSFFRIIGAAEGCPRLALSILEQVVYAPLESRANLIQKVRAEREVIELCREIVKGSNWAQLSSIYKNLKDIEVEQIRRAILGYLKTILLNNHNPEMISNMIGIFEENLFDGGEAKLVRMLYDCCNKGR
jgi:Holliday junction resolvasome RuvABC ATP-dependent DNA helicase subunit